MYQSNRKAFTNITQIIFDLFGIIMAYLITFCVVSFFVRDHALIAERHLWILLIYVPVFFMSMYLLEMYHLSTFNYQDRMIRNVLSCCLMSTLFCLALAPFIQENLDKYHFLGYFVLFSALSLSAERWLSLVRLKKLRNKGICRTIIVGTYDMLENYLYYISKTSFQYDIIGHIHVSGGDYQRSSKTGTSSVTYSHAASGEDNKARSTPQLGEIENIEEILNVNVVDEVVFALPRNYMGEVEKYLLLCEERGITVKLVLDLFDLCLAKTCLLSVGTLPVLTYHTVSLNNTQLFAKRIMDIIGSLVGLAILGVLSVIIVPAIKLDSKGPIFFKQIRVGQNGRFFYLYKFRSMCYDAEKKKKELIKQNKVKDGYMFKVENDPRVTKVGALLRKSSMDELPQFINVLKGEMSLVGTRPPTVDEVQKYKNLHYRRISIKPGITGMWQINGRSDVTDFDEVVKLDTYYIDHWSLWMDVVIIFKTIIMLLFRNKGAY